MFSSSWGWLLFICALFAACLVVFILVLVLPPRKKTLAPQNPVIALLAQDPSGLEQSFVQSNGTIVVDTNTKPFQLTAIRNGPIKPAFGFSNLSVPGFALGTETQATVRGFTFAVKTSLTVVAVQVMDQLFVQGTRTVGIYDVNRSLLLCVSDVSKQEDYLTQGFRTHDLTLEEQVVLAPNTLYACIGLLQVGDKFVTAPSVALPIRDVLMDPLLDDEKLGFGSTGFIASVDMHLPTNFANVGPTSPFASFQVQQKQVLSSAFEVDTQYARFPPRYVHGLNTTYTPTDNRLVVSNGTCANMYDDANVVVPVSKAIVVDTSSLTPDSWFAVYVADDTTNNDAQILVSKNFVEHPNVMSSRMRRVGWLRTKTGTNPITLFGMQQEGVGIRRPTFYLEPATQFQTTLGNNAQGTLQLTFVPPTVSECTLEIEVRFPNQAPFAGFSMDIGSTTVTFFAQAYQVRRVTLPITSTTIPPELPFQMFLFGFVGTNPTVVFRVLRFVEDL